MKRFFCLIIICVSFYACKPGIPKDIIQPDKMEQVLLDIHIVDGYITTLPNADTAKSVGASFYKGVYKKFDIDSALYNASINYYYKHPDIMKKMYDSITVKLNILKEKNPTVADDGLRNYAFKGFFDKNASDSTLVDISLNRKYNRKLLKSNVFINMTNPQGLAPLNLVPNIQANPTPSTTLPIKEVPAAVAAPDQVVPKVQ